LVFALKRVSKMGMNASRAAQLREECRILQSLSCPFIVRLEEAFQTDSYVYLAMTYAGGGDLTLWIEEMTASSARLVTAEVLLGLRYLHSNSIIYRDLKLENTLVSLDGHVLLSDFGVSKRLRVTISEEQNREQGTAEAPQEEGRQRQRLAARTLLGTPFYMAPEQFSGMEYSYYVDYWAAAVMLHELLTGHTTGRYDAPEILDTGLMDPTAANMLTRMLHLDRGQRLGCGDEGLAEIMAHDYFAEVDWAQLERKELPGPLAGSKTGCSPPERAGAAGARSISIRHPPTFTAAFGASLDKASVSRCDDACQAHNGPNSNTDTSAVSSDYGEADKKAEAATERVHRDHSLCGSSEFVPVNSGGADLGGAKVKED